MSEPHACTDCLRRSWLLAQLGPYIERTVVDGSASPALSLLRLGSEDLVAAVAPQVGPKLLGGLAKLGEEGMREELDASGCWACCRHSTAYPTALRGIDDAPRALIGRGDHRMLGRLVPSGVVTIVGSRRATSYGREVARSLGRELADAGLLVLSGLAFGIDACAHRGALDAGAPTVAVLGCGPDSAYPAAHRSLWRQIGEQGAVLSELPPGATPWRWTFPARNRIMAALGGVTVVVEAAGHSGSLLTARLATGLGRAVGAVPGPITSRASAGPNRLLSEGATVVRGAEDVIAALGVVEAGEVAC